MATKPTSIECERNFSKVADIITDKRKLLQNETLSNICVISSLLNQRKEKKKKAEVNEDV